MIKEINALHKLIEQIDTLKATDWEKPDYEVWKGKVIRLVKRIFGENSDYTKEIMDVLNPSMIVTTDTPDSYFERIHINTLDSARLHLKAYLTELEEQKAEDVVNIQSENLEVSLQNLEIIFKKFHFIARSLSKRHHNRDGLEVHDDYDLQYLLRSLMMLFFDDIQPEESTPSYASKSVKMDFLLNREQIVVECKMTSASRNDKTITDELLVDVGRYDKHPKCKKLVCLVYDPGGFIDNKAVLNDLEDKSTPKLSVHVYLVP
jgi:hypothetical protein